MKKHELNRRHLLRGIAGGATISMALPPLEAMFNINGNAYADGGAIPCRYATFFWGNGVRPERFFPKKEGLGWWQDGNETLEPIATNPLIRHKVSVVGNFKCMQKGGAHHDSRAQALTGTYDRKKGNLGSPTGPSVDYFIANKWKGNTRLRSIDLAISRVGKSGRNANPQTSFNDSGKKMPSEPSPSKLFDRLFGGNAPATPMGNVGNDPAIAVRKSMVDALIQDAKALQKRLGNVDRMRIDEHLSGLRALEKTINDLKDQDCGSGLPTRPGDNYNQNRGRELLEEKNKVMADMLALAFACDISRVSSYEFNVMQADTIFWQVGGIQGAHVQTHDDRKIPKDKKLGAQYERVFLSTRFIMKNFAYLCEAMERIPEGDGTVLDNSLLYATTELEDGTKHITRNIPVVIGGSAGGKFKSGVYYRPNNERNLTDLLLTAINAVGVNVKQFGAGASRSNNPVNDLLT